MFVLQRGCADMLAANGMASIVDAAVATCPPKWPGLCIEQDAAELCRGWGFHWDDNRKTCTAAGH